LVSSGLYSENFTAKQQLHFELIWPKLHTPLLSSSALVVFLSSTATSAWMRRPNRRKKEGVCHQLNRPNLHRESDVPYQLEASWGQWVLAQKFHIIWEVGRFALCSHVPCYAATPSTRARTWLPQVCPLAALQLLAIDRLN
jgi:hypothetical protein